MPRRARASCATTPQPWEPPMRAWLPEQQVYGPEPATERDVAGLNRVFAVAFNIAHRSGTEGWMGPLAVRPDRQGGGVGKTIVRTAVDWLLEQRVVTLG